MVHVCPTKNWPFKRKDHIRQGIQRQLFQLGPSKNWPYSRKDHISEDHISGINSICKQYIGHLCFKFWVTNEIIYKATSGQIMSSHQCKGLSFCLHFANITSFLSLIFVLIQTLQDKVHPKKRSHRSEMALWTDFLAINLCKKYTKIDFSL